MGVWQSEIFCTENTHTHTHTKNTTHYWIREKQTLAFEIYS